MKKAIVSVINDLVTDQRVHKSCQTLIKAGYRPVLVGRKLNTSLTMPGRTYPTVRMRLLFTKGPFFYSEFNLRLFFYLLFHPADLLMSNDLDTLLPNYLISKVRGLPLVYDSHEYFTETPELIHRKSVQNVWKWIEKFVLTRTRRMITVNESIADMFRKKYALQVAVVRNIPAKLLEIKPLSRMEAGLSDEKKLMVLQGSGINIDRGSEELVQAMRYLPDVVLMIIGNGDAMPAIIELINRYQMSDHVLLFPRMEYSRMMAYTRLADLGLTLDKDTNLNYRFSLPNKLFDYIHAGVPVLASPLHEIKEIIDRYQIGTFIESHDPQHLAKKIQDIFAQNGLIGEWKRNLPKAAKDLCWENEEKVLMQFIASIHE